MENYTEESIDNFFKKYSIFDENIKLSIKHSLLLPYYDDDNNYPYSDNLRFADVENSEQVMEYKEQLKKGCCGYFDIIIPTVDSQENIKIYIGGFNYGH